MVLDVAEHPFNRQFDTVEDSCECIRSFPVVKASQARTRAWATSALRPRKAVLSLRQQVIEHHF